MLTEEQRINLVSFSEEGESENLDALLKEIEVSSKVEPGALQGFLFIDSDGNERTLLHIASAHGHEETVKVLLNHKFSPKILDEEGNTSLHIACYADSEINFKVVDLLLSSTMGPKHDLINTRNNCGDTALCNALWIKSEVGNEIVKLLVDEGADVNLGDGVLKPLWACFKKNHISDIDIQNFNYLLDHGADYLYSDGVVGNAMHSLASQGFVAMVKILIEKAKQDNSLSKLMVKSHNTLYEGASVLEIAQDSRNADRTEEFQKWYQESNDSIKKDLLVELVGDV